MKRVKMKCLHHTLTLLCTFYLLQVSIDRYASSNPPCLCVLCFVSTFKIDSVPCLKHQYAVSCFFPPFTGVSNWGGYAVACALYILNNCEIHDRYLRKAVGFSKLSKKTGWAASALPSVAKVFFLKMFTQKDCHGILIFFLPVSNSYYSDFQPSHVIFFSQSHVILSTHTQGTLSFGKVTRHTH